MCSSTNQPQLSAPLAFMAAVFNTSAISVLCFFILARTLASVRFKPIHARFTMRSNDEVFILFVNGSQIVQGVSMQRVWP